MKIHIYARAYVRAYDVAKRNPSCDLCIARNSQNDALSVEDTGELPRADVIDARALFLPLLPPPPPLSLRLLQASKYETQILCPGEESD